MPSPIFVFSFVVATLLGAGFLLVLGGDMRRLAIFLLACWLGFGLGHLAGVFLAVKTMNIGVLRFLPALFGTFIALLFAQALTIEHPNR